jgi:hypothetical protein
MKKSSNRRFEQDNCRFCKKASVTAPYFCASQRFNQRCPRYRCSGVYVVYAGRQTSKEHCALRKLLYIGESGDIETRLGNEHEKYEDWKSLLKNGEILYFSFAKVDLSCRE